MVRVFTGFDPRESVGWHVFVQSLMDFASDFVSVVPLDPIVSQRDGSNSFTYARFLVPYLCDFHGRAIFVDGADMLMRADIVELWKLFDCYSGVQVVKHDYRTKHPRKYLGTSMEMHNPDYPCKNWSSMVLWNCDFFAHRVLTPDYIEKQPGSFLHRFGWMDPDRVGELPAEWNHLVREYVYSEDAKLVHYTLGIPAFDQYRDDDYADEWFDVYRRVEQGLQEVQA